MVAALPPAPSHKLTTVVYIRIRKKATERGLLFCHANYGRVGGGGGLFVPLGCPFLAPPFPLVRVSLLLCPNLTTATQTAGKGKNLPPPRPLHLQQFACRVDTLG